MIYHKNTQQGFALLMSLVIVGVVISVALSLIEITIKQVRLSTTGRDSESAFYAANGGAECMQYHRRTDFASFEAQTNNVSVSCFGDTDTANGASLGAGIFRYDYELNWSVEKRCSKVTMITLNSNPGDPAVTLNDVPTVIPSYPDDDFICPGGGRCTIMSVKGYSATCANINNAGVVEREVLLEL